MELNDLEIFRSVAKHGSMSKAAAELGYVQSNVTSRIRALEEEFGVRLLDRPLRIGASQTLTAAYLREVLLDPDGGAQLFTRTLDELSAMLDGGELDLILVNREPEGAERWIRRFEADEPIGWAAGSSVSAQEAGSALPPELPVLAARDPFCPYRRQTLNWLAETDSPRRLIEADTLDSVIAIVESGRGIALLPRKLHTPRMRETEMPGFREEAVKIAVYARAELPEFAERKVEEFCRNLQVMIEQDANGPIKTGETA